MRWLDDVLMDWWNAMLCYAILCDVSPRPPVLETLGPKPHFRNLCRRNKCLFYFLLFFSSFLRQEQFVTNPPFLNSVVSGGKWSLFINTTGCFFLNAKKLYKKKNNYSTTRLGGKKLHELWGIQLFILVFAKFTNISAKFEFLNMQIKNNFKNVIFIACKWCKVFKYSVNSMVISCFYCQKKKKNALG